MTTVPTPETDRVEQALKTLLYRFKGAPMMSAWVASLATECQELENEIVRLWVYRALPYAEGDNLDTLGRIVGEGRRQRTDEQYRVALGSRVRINKSGSTVEEILYSLTASYDADYWLREHSPASMHLTVMEPITSDLASELFSVLGEAKGAGISISMSWGTTPINNVLTLASGSTPEYDPDRGLGNLAGTTGGKCIRYVRP